MCNYEGELYETYEQDFFERELMWRFRVMDAENPDAAMAEILSLWAHQVDAKVGARVCGVLIERV